MKYLIRALGAIAILLSASSAFAQGTLPLALNQQFNSSGQPLAGALLYTYVVGTVAQPQSTYQDTGLTILNQWPLTADQSGRIPMFYLANGSTHARLTDSGGNVVYDNPNILVIGPSGGSGAASIDQTSVLSSGDLKVKYGTGPLAGYVRANGMTIGNASSSATERQNADTQNLFVYLYNTDPNLTVTGGLGGGGGRSGNALNDYNNGARIALPDWRGKTITALADMGNSPWGGYVNSYANCITGNVTTLGSDCGLQNHTMLVGEIATHTPTTNTATISGTAASAGGHNHNIYFTDPGHYHSGTSVPGGQFHWYESVATGVFQDWMIASCQGCSSNTPTAYTGAYIGSAPSTNDSTTTVNGAHTHTVSGSATVTMNSVGSSSPFTIVPPALLATVYIKL